ncbi:MAG: DUF3298 domain-containing protein [Bacteroidales bacterium]|nr:DUF3298 domain-containing protein [Bacteroidales bacterium]
MAIKRTPFVFLCMLLFMSISFNANAITSMKRYSAKTANMFHIMYLERIDELLSANLYHYSFNNIEKNYFERVELIGKMIDDNKFSLKIIGQREEFMSGSFINEDIVVEMGDNPFEDGLIRFAYSVHEESIPLRIIWLQKSFPYDTDDPFSPSASLDLTIVLSNESGNVKVDSQLITFSGLSGERYDSRTEIEALVEKAINRYAEQYKSMPSNKENPEFRASSWERLQQIQPLLNNSGLLCLEKTIYAYTGGTHGLTHISYLLINEEGNQLTPDDIFREGYREMLGKMIQKQIRSLQIIGDEEEFTSVGFFTNEILPNENMYINHSGLGFVYNIYEIAAYYKGHIRVHFTPADLADLIQPGIWKDKLWQIFYPDTGKP